MTYLWIFLLLATTFFFTQAQDVVCKRGWKKVEVNIGNGESYSFKTQAKGKYKSNTKCIVKYRKLSSCSNIRFFCPKFDIRNNNANCKHMDKMVIKSNGKTMRFCQKNGPDITTAGNLKVSFFSNQKKQAAGATCTVECVDETTTTTTTTATTTTTTSTTTTAKGNSSCPRERPDFQSSCTGQEGLSCEYGTQTCCGETSPEMMMECHKEGEKGLWQGYFVDTICMLGGSCPPGPTKPTPPVSCICTEQYSPVCGVDGKTYSNTCYAACEGGGGVGVAVSCAGECPCKDCICPEVYSPVCGSDGQTYSNACKANCAGVEVAAQGECA